MRQRWRPHHKISHRWKPHPRCKHCDAMINRTGVIDDISFGIKYHNVSLVHSDCGTITSYSVPQESSSKSYFNIHKKLSYCWQTTQHLRTLIFNAVLLAAALWWMTAIYWPDFLTLPTSLPFDAYSYRVHIWYGKTRMAGLQSDEGRMIIDSVIWAQHIIMTDAQSAMSPQQMPCPHCVGRQKRFWHGLLEQSSDIRTDATAC